VSSDNSLRIELGKRIRAFRMSKGITGQELAKMAEISPAYLSEVERGLSEVSGEKLLRIAGSLGVSMQGLLDGTASNTASTNEVSFPTELARAAEELGWSYSVMARLYEGKQSLVAKRSSGVKKDWSMQQWIDFYNAVKDYMQVKGWGQ